jgi:hypothetical protein
MSEIDKNEDLPQTVEEAVDLIVSKLSEDDVSILLGIESPRGMIKFHHGWGTQLRNSLGLWRKESPLRESTGMTHADDASGVIMRAVWERIHNERGNKS